MFYQLSMRIKINPMEGIESYLKDFSRTQNQHPGSKILQNKTPRKKVIFPCTVVFLMIFFVIVNRTKQQFFGER